MDNTSNKTGKILVVDDNTDVLSAARLFLKRHFLHVDVERDRTISPTWSTTNTTTSFCWT